ncbi:MAG: hypothetical protein PF503_20020 [Desulfobacula sp.]|jgi:hypothetical protein|nr:hypothetical protein [Desulfobacula sp.]
MAITFNAATSTSTFADLIIDSESASTEWYQLWSGNAAGTVGDYVDTTAYYSGGRGWIMASDLDSVRADFAQSGDDTLYVKTYSAAAGSSVWDNGAVAFDDIADVSVTTDVTGGTMIADMFNDESFSSGSWYRVWIGNTAGESSNGHYLDTSSLDNGAGEGWIAAADLANVSYVPGAEGTAQEFWIKAWSANSGTGSWENWTVSNNAAEGEFAITQDAVNANFWDLAVDGTNGPLEAPDGGLVADGGAGIQKLHVTGTNDMRIDLTNFSNQAEGLDLDGSGTIATNGIENNVQAQGILSVANFEVFDFYASNPIDSTDTANNYFGDVNFDGTGYNGDGVTTDGTVYLGGRGVDIVFTGVGNDFIAAGGVDAGRFVPGVNAVGAMVIIDTQTGLPVAAALADVVDGGRNADFFYMNMSAIDAEDGNGTTYRGGETWDSNSDQDSDWALLEISDDNEPVAAIMNTSITLNSGTMAAITNIEHLDASGDLYSFLDSFDTVLGGMRDYKSAHAADGTENSGLGSTGQIVVTDPMNVMNIIVGGYDNDTVNAGGGNDIIFGGKLQYLLAYANNPNLVDASNGLDLNVNSVGTVNDGMDSLFGGAGNDTIVFEMDGGNYDGGVVGGVTGAAAIAGGGDNLFVTDFSMGRMQGQTAANELAQGTTAQADALAALTTDSVVRLDLGVGQGVFYRGYGGADTLNNEIVGQNFTADQTQYAAGVARSTIQDMTGIIATGLGTLDYDADGSNISDFAYRYQADFGGLAADMDLRGFDGADDDNMFGYTAAGALNTVFNLGDNTLYANTGDDVLEGRGGDDLLSGGAGHDDFIFSLGAVDDDNIIHRQIDADQDGIWDGTFGQDYRTDGDPTSADPSTITYSMTDPGDVISVLFTLDGVPLSASGATITSATTMTELAQAVNDIISAIDAGLSAAADGDTLVVTDAGGRPITSPSIAGDLDVDDFTASAVIDNGLPVQITDDIDRLIFKSYANRSTGLGTDDTLATLGGVDYAEDLVVGFEDDGAGNVTTTLAETQNWQVQFQNLNIGDVVTVTINGVDYARTMVAGDVNTDGFVANFANQITNLTWDIHSTSGQVNAVTADVIVGSVNERVLVLTETATGPDAAQHVFMSAPTVTIINPSGTPGTAAVEDFHNNSVELVDYDGRDNDINDDTVIFVGRSGANDNYGRDALDPTDIADGSTYSHSVLATALTAGGTLTGSDAILVDTTGNGTNDTALHGDDYLIGAAGADVLNGGTGDDRFEGSLGIDTIDGGGNDAAGIAGNVYQDALIFNEDNFGAGTSFNVVIGGIGSTNAGVVTATGAGAGVTTYTGIELVRTLSNTASDTLNFATLSDEIAATTTAGATQALRDMIANEGVTLNYNAGAAITHTVDTNNNDALIATETNVADSAVQGTEHVIGGGANDNVFFSQNEVGTANNVDLAGNASNEGALTLGADTVTYTHNAPWTPAQTPDLTVAVSAASTIVTSANGILGVGTSVSDVLTGVEVVGVLNAAVSSSNIDTVDLTGIDGAIFNYGGNLVVNNSLQANGNGADLTAALADFTVLGTGGISQAGVGQGHEILTITNATLMERVTGGAGNDRVVVANNMNDNTAVAAATPDLGFMSYLGDGEGLTAATNDALVTADPAYNGLFRFDLGAGTGDMMDYTNEAGNVAVVLATDGTELDRVLVDGNADGNLNNGVVADGDRVDLATGAERYIAGAGLNFIDLGESTVATTIDFSQQVTLNGSPSPMDNGNEFIDPDGFNGVADTDMLGIEVRDTALGTVFGSFMDDPNGTGFGWIGVAGNALAQTVEFTNNETGTNHILQLMGGANAVDYSALTADRTLTFFDTTDAGVAFAGFDAVNNKMQSTYIVSGEDTISIWRDALSGTGTLTVTGTGEANDIIDISNFAAVVANGQHVVNLTTQQVIEDQTNTNAVNGNFVTSVVGFENVTGSAFADHITGNGQDNDINSAAGADEITGAGGQDNITLTVDGAVDRVFYTTVNDGDTVMVGTHAVSTVNADTVADFLATGDQLVFSGALQALLVENGTVATVAGGGGINLAADGIFNSSAGGAALASANTFAANNVAFGDLAAELGAVAGAAAGDDAILIIGDGVSTGVYYYQEDGTTLATIDAADTLQLLTVLTAIPGTLADGDIVTRTVSAAGGEAIDANSLGVVEVAYDLQTDSVMGSRDEIDFFTTGTDKIDLSVFDFGGFTSAATEDLDGSGTADRAEAIIYQTPVSVDSAATLTDFFLDTVNLVAGQQVDRSVVIQREGATNDYRIFVDVNMDGDFVQADDMVVDITNETLGGGMAGGLGDIIFA